LIQGLLERSEPGLTFRVVRGRIHKHTDAPHPLGRLPLRHEWPSG